MRQLPRTTIATAVLLATLVTAGLAFVRGAFTSSAALEADIAGNRLTYGYVVISTLILVITVGYVLGGKADQWRRLSMTDALTGLGNRRAFDRRLHREWRHARRSGWPLAVLLLDLDGLKRINDTQGHAAGDRALRMVGRAVQSTLRAMDFGARWGGDELAVIAPNTAHLAAAHLAERLRERVASYRRSSDVAVTASIGVAVLLPGDPLSKTPLHLLRDADAALYEAKMRGRNRVSVA